MLLIGPIAWDMIQTRHAQPVASPRSVLSWRSMGLACDSVCPSSGCPKLALTGWRQQRAIGSARQHVRLHRHLLNLAG